MDILTPSVLLFTSWSGLDALELLVLAPVLEESIFRRGVHEALLRRPEGVGVRGSVLANVATALLFALCHVALQPGALSALTLFPALVIGWIYQNTRRLAPCIVAHAALNAAWMLGRHLVG
jgi:membrane protease YdiL (CAAX protease family)